MNVQSLAEYKSRHCIDARDSDIQSLPDEPDSSKSNVPMVLVVICVAFPLLLALVIHLVRVSLS